VQLTIPDEHNGQRLDLVLATLVPQHSRSQLQRLIKDGRVNVNDQLQIKVSTPVEAGQTITIDIPPPAPSATPPQDLPLDIVYEDPDLLVLNKEAGMVVHPASGHGEGTLVNALLHHVKDLSGIGGEVRPGIVHRLDRGTSGLMVVAKTNEAHEALAAQFHDRQVDKEYTALIWGVLRTGHRIEDPIGRDPVHRKKMTTRRAVRARTAVTRVTWAEHFPGVALIGVAIATGRTHQIRVHLSSIGHPVVGDPLYGGIHRRVPPELRAVQKLERPFLHAAKLAFTHPRDGRPMTFESSLPSDLAEVLEKLRYDLEHLRY
jgi:23S rRNA pseudouridine1911/1915/1917 synthase